MSEEVPLSASNGQAGTGQAGNGRRPVGRAEVPPGTAEGQSGTAREDQGQSGTAQEELSELDALGSVPEGATAREATVEEAAAARGEVERSEEDPDAALAELAQKTLSELERERDEYLDMLRRLQAEFENYRKRIERNQREMVENANASLVKKLLPVLDTADLALAHGASEDVKQVAGALFDVLCKEGLERIDPEGESFDPEHHDAVAHEPVEGEEAPERPEVSEVMRAGYRWKGRVLRPAMVKVRG
jgi:molecular chaperone GrpE